MRGTGAYAVEAQGVDELRAALKQIPNGMRDLRRAWRPIAEAAAQNVEQHAPESDPTKWPKKAGRGHNPPGYLKRTIKYGATQNSPWVRIGDAKTPYLIVQEFGGSSYWHTAGAGAFRNLNRGHKKITNMGDRTVGYEFEYSTKKGSRRAARGLRTQLVARGHITYTKQRRPRGYFIWNVGYRLRSFIGSELETSINEICAESGLTCEMKSWIDNVVGEPTEWTGD